MSCVSIGLMQDLNKKCSKIGTLGYHLFSSNFKFLNQSLSVL
jgi:hypothetical protein